MQVVSWEVILGNMARVPDRDRKEVRREGWVESMPRVVRPLLGLCRVHPEMRFGQHQG